MKEPSPRLVLRPTLDGVLVVVLLATLAGTALAAYSVGGVPVQWVAQAILAGTGIIWLLMVGRIPGRTRAVVFGAFLLWACAINIANLAQFSGRMPPLATLPYVTFVLMRYLAVVAFASAFFLTLWLASRGHGQRLLAAIVWIGIAVSIVALYIHVAQWLGLPEPVRSRLGTGGEQQAVTFSTGNLFYRRALGTFREPSHLAEWLLLPLFASAGLGGRAGVPGAALTGVVIVLTVSLTGALSACAGFLGGLILLNPLRRRNRRLLTAVAVLAAIAVLVFRQVQIGTTDEALALAEVTQQRLAAVLTSGYEASGRSIWVDLLSREPFPVFGYGLGNANIVASEWIGSDLVVSFLSLYVNTLYATGVVGLALLMVFLVQPLVRHGPLRARPARAFLMAYIAFMVAAAGSSEELSVPFGVAAGFLEYYRRQPPYLARGVPYVAPPTDSRTSSVRRAELVHE